MTEQEWLACTDPATLLNFLKSRRKRSPRRSRLFAAAVCRRVWGLLTDEAGRRAVEVAELFADGLADRESRSTARRAAARSREAAWEAYLIAANYIRGSKAARAVSAARDSNAWEAAYRAAGTATFAVLATLEPQDAADWAREAAVAAGEAGGSAKQGTEAQGERSVQSALLRCIFGNPFRPPLAVDPGWLAWNDGTVKKLAESIYAERAFDRLPILADALEEAGCTDADMLAHCRGPGPHVRGCWVVDALRGKQ